MQRAGCVGGQLAPDSPEDGQGARSVKWAAYPWYVRTAGQEMKRPRRVRSVAVSNSGNARRLQGRRMDSTFNGFRCPLCRRAHTLGYVDSEDKSSVRCSACESIMPTSWVLDRAYSHMMRPPVLNGSISRQHLEMVRSWRSDNDRIRSQAAIASYERRRAAK